MQSLRRVTAAALVVIVGLMLCGAPQWARAQQTPSPSPSSQEPLPPATGQQQEIPLAETPVPQRVPSPTGSSVDPSQGPLEPLPPSPQSQQQQLPEAPAAQPSGTPQAPPVPMANAPAQQQQQTSEPVGTATAERTPTAGGAASEPAGTAIAPGKQRQVRSFLIKLGAVAAGGIALGTIFALSRGTSPAPPGAK